MLMIIEIKTLIKDLVAVSDNKYIDKIDNNNKISRAKSPAKSQVKLAKSKNLMGFIQQSFRLGFFILKSKVVFTKLR